MSICLDCKHDHGSPPEGVFVLPGGTCNARVPFDGFSCHITVHSDGRNEYAKIGDPVPCYCHERIDRDRAACLRERHGVIPRAAHERIVPGEACDECKALDEDEMRRYRLAEAEVEPLRAQIAAVWEKHGLPNYDEERD